MRISVGQIRPGESRLRLYPDAFLNMRLCLPPLAEQAEIVTVLAKQLNALDALNSEAEQGIQLLLERRSALISAAVTGKIDVRGLAPQPEGQCCSLSPREREQHLPSGWGARPRTSILPVTAAEMRDRKSVV